MRKILCVSVLVTLFGCAAPHTNLNTQAEVDLSKYMGKWYEQARLPNRFQKDCVDDVQAEYALAQDDTVVVTNQCRKKDGSIVTSVGEGRLAKTVDSKNPAKLEVRFAPEWLSWIPFVWGDYWILKLQGDYEYSLVGTPNRKYLWVLSRNEKADPAAVKKLLDYAQAQGFNTDNIILAP